MFALETYGEMAGSQNRDALFVAVLIIQALLLGVPY